VLAEAHKVIAGLALPQHSKCSVVGESFADDIGEDVVELHMFLPRGDVPGCGDTIPCSLLVVFIVSVIISGAWWVMGVVRSAAFAAFHCRTGVPRVAVLVLVCSIILVMMRMSHFLEDLYTVVLPRSRACIQDI